MDTSDMERLARDVLSEWLHGSYFGEDIELANWLYRNPSQKIVEVTGDQYDQVFLNRETGEKFRIELAVYEVKEETA